MVLMAVTNILIFSVWYWIIDPPGIDETKRDDAPCISFFRNGAPACRANESWEPRYTDYLYLAFTASFALARPRRCR